MYDTRRTVTWERYALALNGFTSVCSLRYPLIGLTRNLIFAGKVPFLERVTYYITMIPCEIFVLFSFVVMLVRIFLDTSFSKS